ncbi:uncharacterized protein LOC134270210 [Saccostrea cucullata]|uniref:uncharacterized protein LOC134270210 n=1 Tax=Saccostrea cuccullata TaxID=36930 RepID=UPI002ED0EE9C
MRTLLITCALVASVSAACIPGGYCPVTDPSSNADVQEMAQFALTAYAAKSHDVSACDGTFSVKHASRQTVAGFNYRMTVEATCDGQKTVCEFTVFDQSWTKTRELTYDHCTTSHKRAALAGGLSHADTSSDQFQDAMEYAASQVDMQRNSMYKTTPVHYSHCFQQVVAGIRYVCDVTLTENSCLKGDTRDLSLCAVKSNGESTTWHVDIVSQPWMSNKYTIQTLTMKQ